MPADQQVDLVDDRVRVANPARPQLVSLVVQRVLSAPAGPGDRVRPLRQPEDVRSAVGMDDDGSAHFFFLGDDLGRDWARLAGPGLSRNGGRSGGRTRTLLVSGGTGSGGYDEPAAMRRYLEAAGSP